ncbi:hypothetical protein M8818_007256 [Zalaria obscura]|uniref:Uncharacterized protein n=1 Tax=Zalaria obscura TaxID=2024903 RepID=A0ACC3S4E9_9PEZI
MNVNNLTGLTRIVRKSPPLHQIWHTCQPRVAPSRSFSARAAYWATQPSKGQRQSAPNTASDRPTLVYKPVPRPSKSETPPVANEVEHTEPTTSEPKPKQKKFGRGYEYGLEAAQRVVREGKLPEEYKAPGRRITMIIAALPILIVTSWVLWQRCKSANVGEFEDHVLMYVVVEGKEQKHLVAPLPSEDGDTQVIVAEAEKA